MTTLIFPTGMPAAIAYAHECVARKKPVIGASSLLNDPSREHYAKWRYLPYVTSPEFPGALQTLLTASGISEVFTANPAVWSALNGLLPELAPTVTLLGDSAVSDTLGRYYSSSKVAENLWSQREFLFLEADARSRMSETCFASMVYHADAIPGMCDHQKLLALSEIFRVAPPGDVVEIGSWWGKSAFILAFLARQYEIGNTLCVDPWSPLYSVQGIKLLDDMVEREEMIPEEAHRVFLLNLLPYFYGRLNFIREPSVVAATVYKSRREVCTDTFGTTSLAGKIAVLHIDGNHRLSDVEADAAAWVSLVADGGWVIFDDYRWTYGDGPRVVADSVIARHKDQIDQTFYSGGSMFIRFGSR